MSARPLAVVAAVVHDDDETIEGGADGVGGADVGRHVLIRAFRAREAAVERVDDDGDGPWSPSCRRMSATRARASATRLNGVDMR